MTGANDLERAVQRARTDCRLRAAMLLLELDLPDALADALPDLVFALARSWREAADETVEVAAPVMSAYRALSRALAHRDIALAGAARAQAETGA